MTALPLTLVLVLGGLTTPPRDARPPPAEAPAAEPAQDLSAAEIAARVETYLGAIDTRISAAQWKALGPKAVAPLAAVVNDPQALPSRRAQALGALSFLGGAQAREVVLQAARSEAEPFAVRASALHGAARLLRAPDLVRTLRPVMEGARQPLVRASAAEVLARHAAATSCQAIRAQADREGHEARGHFAGALERCAAAAP